MDNTGRLDGLYLNRIKDLSDVWKSLISPLICSLKKTIPCEMSVILGVKNVQML